MLIKKLKAVYYAITNRDIKTHLWLYTVVCKIFSLEEPTVYDIDRITERMNYYVKTRDYCPDKGLVKILNTIKDIEYDREFVKKLQRIIYAYRDVDPRPTMDDCSSYLFHIITVNIFKFIWEILTAKG